MWVRRLGIGLACAAFCAGAAMAGQRGWTAADNSVSFRLNPQHTNSINFSGGFSPHLKLAWAARINSPNALLVPTVANGTVFVVERVHVALTGDVLHALRLSDGRELWFHLFKRHIGDLFAAPAYDNGTVFVPDQLGRLYALAADTGKMKWQLDLPKQRSTYTSPIAANGQVFVNADGNGSFSSIYGIDQATGAVNWAAKTNFGGDGSPAFDGGNGIFTAPPCNYYRFDALTGQQVWYQTPTIQCHGGGGQAPFFFEGRVYIQDPPANLLMEFDAATGAPLGSRRVAWRVSPAFYVDGKGKGRGLSIYGSSLTSWLVSSHKTKWTYKPPGAASFGSAPIVINGLVFVGISGHPDIVVLNADSGKVLNVFTPAMDTCGSDCFAIPELSAGDGALMVDEGASLMAYVPE